MLDMCEDRASCSVKASPETFTQDPCEETSKYLEVHYKCRPNEYERQTVCEGDVIHISCKKGDGIAVYSAMFGRTPNGTVKCPANKHGYIDCPAANTVSEVRTQCHGKRNCAIQANESIFGDPCPMGTHKYLTVSYACVPRKILKQIHQKKNRKKKKKKKKKDPDKVTKLPRDDNFTEVSSTQSASDISSAPSLPEVYETFEQLPVTQGSEDTVTTGSVRQEENQKPSKDVDDRATDVTTVQDKMPGVDDVTLVNEKTNELDANTIHEEASTLDDIITEPSMEDSSTDVNKKTNDEVYYKSFEDITTSVILSPNSTDQQKDHKNEVNVQSPENGAGHFGESAEEIDNSRPHSGSNNNNTYHVKHEDYNSFDRVKEDTSGANPTLPKVETTLSTMSTNIHKDTGSVLNPDHKSVSNSNHTMEKKDSAFVTERNLTVLCMNYTRPDVRWGGMQRPRDQRSIGFLKDWLSICHYLKTHQEKTWLYFTLGICFGIIVMLVVVLVKVCCNFRRNIRARLDVSEPTHRSAHINNHSSLDAPMLEHSDSMDRIEVVRFSPRSTLRSLRSNSHNRDLVNYYG